MASVLRATSTPALNTLLASGAPTWRADLFTLNLLNGATYNWTSWDTDLTIAGVTYSSRKPWLTRGAWNVVNTMQVPALQVTLRALNDGFAGGANIKTQIHDGLFDGAAFTLTYAYGPRATPGVVTGTVGIFGGVVGQVDLTGTTATLAIKGKNNNLDQFIPRTLFQIGCNHAFCDPGCTLLRASFTSAFTVGAAPTATFIPWTAAPGTPSNFQSGTIKITGGAGAGQSRTIAFADSTGVTVEYPFYIVPAPGDAISCFQGCDKTLNSGSGQSCTDRSNTQNFRGYPYVPPPNAAY